MEAEPHLPSWYLMPQARDKKRRWYRVQCTYRTRLLNGEIQGYMSSEWSENTQKALKQAQAGLQEEREKKSALNPMWCCRDETATTATLAAYFIWECATSLGHHSPKHLALLHKEVPSAHGVPIRWKDVRKKNNNFPVYHRASRYKQHSSNLYILGLRGS